MGPSLGPVRVGDSVNSTDIEQYQGGMPGSLDLPAGAIPAPSPAKPDMYQAVLAALRGRYMWVVVLGILGAVAGFYFGRKMGKVFYVSEASIRLMKYGPSTLGLDADETKGIPNYDVYMKSLVLKATSDGVIEKAMQEPEWQATGIGDSLAAKDAFGRSLTVEHPDDSENLVIMYKASSAGVAAAGSQSLTNAFIDDYVNEGQAIAKDQLAVLNTSEANRMKDIQSINQQILAKKDNGLATGNGMEPAQRYKDAEAHEADVALRLAKLEDQIEIAKMIPQATAAVVAQVQAAEPNDPELKGAEAQRYALQEELADLQAQHVGPANPQYHVLSEKLDRLNANIKKRVEELQVAATAGVTVAGTAGGPVDASLDDMEVNEKVLQSQHERAITELKEAQTAMTAVMASDADVQPLVKQVDLIWDEVYQIQAKKHALEAERNLANRLEIYNKGAIPLVPAQDNRLKYGVAGGFAGMCLPIGLMVLLGFVNRRYRYADEMTRDLDIRGGAALLGVLPVLPADMKDFERSADAAQCMHQIRVLLQIGGRPGAKVFLVTSASPGEGKTSLTAALGLSFMASGARTLLMDCDLVGQALTRGYEATGWRGLREAMAGETLESCVREIRPGLALMPAGGARAVDACAVSPQVIKPILAAARQNYDVVLIDSGPLLGSVEASVLAPQVDEVVVTISRGQQPLLVRRTFQHLKSLGASIAGCVFNRAGKRDFASSYPGSSLRSVNPEEVAIEPERRPSRLGPLVESVDRFMPGAEEHHKQA